MYEVIEDINKLLSNVTTHLELILITGDTARMLAEKSKLLVLEAKHAYSYARERKSDKLSFISNLKRLFAS